MTVVIGSDVFTCETVFFSRVLRMFTEALGVWTLYLQPAHSDFSRARRLRPPASPCGCRERWEDIVLRRSAGVLGVELASKEEKAVLGSVDGWVCGGRRVFWVLLNCFTVPATNQTRKMDEDGSFGSLWQFSACALSRDPLFLVVIAVIGMNGLTLGHTSPGSPKSDPRWSTLSQL